MKNILILITGMPATGKSTFASWLSSELCVPLVSYDNIKRKTIDLSDSHERCDVFAPIPYEIFLFMIEEIMKSSSPVIADYIFSDHTKDALDMLTVKYGYTTSSVHMDTDIETAHSRFMERNNREAENNGLRPKEITLEQFSAGVKQNREFRYGGDIVFVDTTDFKNISYENILAQIRKVV
jgi:shikimate kinase